MPDLFPAKKKRPPPADISESLASIVASMRSHPKSCVLLGLNTVDLRCVEDRVRKAEYVTVSDFVADMRKMLSCAFATYTAGTSEHQATTELNDKFDRLLPRTERPMRDRPPKERLHRDKDRRDKKERPPAKPMTRHQKSMLAQHIMQLEKQFLSEIVEMVSGYNQNRSAGDKFEFDIDKLPPEVCRELKNYVRRCKRKLNPEKRKPRGDGQSKPRSKKTGEAKEMVLESDSESPGSSASSSCSSSSSEAEEDNGDLSRAVASK